MRHQYLAPLYGLAKTKKIKRWYIEVFENEDRKTATIVVENGYIDGKIKYHYKVISKGKNIGKSNETDPFQQAVSEAQSAWNKKRDKNYELEPMDPNNYKPRIMLPMLASKQGKGKIKYPCYIQPKLNGICNLAEVTWPHPPGVLHHSRGGKLFETVPHLDQLIYRINPPGPLHGELYKHGWSLQKIGSYTKELKEDYDQLEFWVYDMAWLGHTFEERINFLAKKILPVSRIPVKFTQTEKVFDYQQAKLWHDHWVSQGFEGAILKNINGLYMFEFNSEDIEKMKDYDDDEFKIIGGKQGTGLDEGCIIYRCVTKEGEEFDVRPRGSVEERQEMYRNLPNDIGKMLTVRFAEYSDKMVPQQPVGDTIRDYE